MSIISSTLRRSAHRALSLSNPSFTRGLISSATTHAAPATATTPTSRFVRKTPVPATSRSAATGGSGTSAYKPYAARSPRPTTTPSRAAPATTVQTQDFVDDFPEDFSLPSSEPQIDDYAHLSPPPASQRSQAQPTASPPLSNLPGDGYTPLPSVSAGSSIGAGAGLGPGSGIQGEAPTGLDWSTSFAGLSERPFERETADALLKPLSPEDVEVKPDGLLYLPEIKYRRTLNAAFGPGGWGLAPRGETHVGPRIVSREWGLVCLGRLVSIARGEQEYFDPSGIPTATEACKSNALMRCCKDLGIASELWDPSFIRDFKKQHCVEVFVEHATKRTKKKLWRKKTAAKFDYPWKEGI